MMDVDSGVAVPFCLLACVASSACVFRCRSAANSSNLGLDEHLLNQPSASPGADYFEDLRSEQTHKQPSHEFEHTCSHPPLPQVIVSSQPGFLEIYMRGAAISTIRFQYLAFV